MEEEGKEIDSEEWRETKAIAKKLPLAVENRLPDLPRQLANNSSNRYIWILFMF